MTDFAAEFIETLMKDIISELKNRKYEADSIREIGDGAPIVFVYLENIRVCSLTFYDAVEPHIEEGLYFQGGDLNYDSDENLIQIDLNNKDYIDQIINLVESKRKYLGSEGNNHKTDDPDGPCIYTYGW